MFKNWGIETGLLILWTCLLGVILFLTMGLIVKNFSCRKYVSCMERQFVVVDSFKQYRIKAGYFRTDGNRDLRLELFSCDGRLVGSFWGASDIYEDRGD